MGRAEKRGEETRGRGNCIWDAIYERINKKEKKWASLKVVGLWQFFFQLQSNSPFAESFPLLPLSRSELFKSLKEISMLGIWEQPEIW